MIVGENIFATRLTGDNLCSYAGQRPRENRACGLSICEGGQRKRFVARFWAPPDPRALREVPPDNDLLTDEQRREPSLRFESEASKICLAGEDASGSNSWSPLRHSVLLQTYLIPRF